MDDVDRAILKELTKNPQIPFIRIAEKAGVTVRTVQKRYQRMKDDGIILNSSIIIDLSKIGYEGKAYIEITNTPSRDKAETIDALKKMPNIFQITDVIGKYDVFAIVAVRSFKAIMDLVSNIRKLPSVEQAEVTFVTDTLFPVPKEFNELYL